MTSAFRPFLPALAMVYLLPGCGVDPPPPGCQMEVLAHLEPLPPAPDAFDYQYSEVAAKDGIAYLGAAHGAGVLVLDVTTGQTLSVLDAGLARTINSVAVDGNLLAFAPGGVGLVVYDISNPRVPGRRVHLPEPVRYCHTVFIHKEIVYCSTSSSDDPQVAFFRVTTPADPAAPLELAPAGRYFAPLTPEEEQNGRDVIVHDLYVHEKDGRRLAYLAFWERGLQVIDVTDPAAPRLLGASPPTPTRWTHSVWVEGDFAYVGEESYKGVVRVFDVSDPATPTEVGQLRSGQGDAISAHNVQVANGFVYASWYQDGLRVFPADGAANPREVAYFHTWNGADNRENPAPFDVRFTGNWDVFVEGGRIYASDMQTGLWVLRHQPAAQACADRSRGTSAFASSGRPPVGWSNYQPLRLRPNRAVPFSANLIAVDPYFDLTDSMVQDLNPRLSLSGAANTAAAQVLPSPASGSLRILRGAARVPSSLRAGTLWIVGEINDQGARRILRGPIEVLPEPAPNQDVEPNEDVYLASVLRHEPGDPVMFSGNLNNQDRRDMYIFESPGAPPSFRLVSPSVTGDLAQPAALLIVSRLPTIEQSFGTPAMQAVSDPAGPGVRQVLNVPGGVAGPLYVTVRIPVDFEDPKPLTYQLEIDRP